MIRVIFFVLCFLMCSVVAKPQDSAVLPGLRVYEEFEAMRPLLHQQNDTVYVVNFWATWCRPCVKELPYFEQLHEAYKGQPVAVILVSLDFEEQIERKLKPFIVKNNLQLRVVVLTDADANSWINAVSPEWSGAIPATLVYKGAQQQFYEQSFESYAELENIIKPFINP